MQKAFKDGELEKDFIAVVRFQGPKSNGMPELHGLMPPMGVLQDKGFKVAIVTDGRMSGASGKVPSVIHVTPEAKEGGILSKIKTGDKISLDLKTQSINLLINKDDLLARQNETIDLSSNFMGIGRELFTTISGNISDAEDGATIFKLPGEELA